MLMLLNSELPSYDYEGKFQPSGGMAAGRVQSTESTRLLSVEYFEEGGEGWSLWRITTVVLLLFGY